MPPDRWRAARGEKGQRAARTVCDCGTEKLVNLNSMRSGHSLSCGCIKREQMAEWWSDPEYVAGQRSRGQAVMQKFWEDPSLAADVSERMSRMNRERWADPEYAEEIRAAARQRMTVHGLARHPLYPIHVGMLNRCYKPTARGFQNYGGRGVRVVGSWHALEVALPEMSKILGPRPVGSSLDRIDNNGHYKAGNIRWASRAAQMANRGHGVVQALDGPPCNGGPGCICRRF